MLSGNGLVSQFSPMGIPRKKKTPKKVDLFSWLEYSKWKYESTPFYCFASFSPVPGNTGFSGNFKWNALFLNIILIIISLSHYVHCDQSI